MAQCQVGHPPTWTCSACPGLNTEPVVRAPAHFNARGELIHYTVLPPALSIASVPSEDSAMMDAPGSPDTDLDNLELAYPDDELTDPAPPPPTPPPKPPALCTPPTPSHSHPTAPLPLPRRAPRAVRTTAPPPAIVVPSVPHVYSVPHSGLLPSMPPRAMPMPMPLPIPVHPMPVPVSAVPAPPQIPCATAGCGGAAPAAGRRCLACVRGSWAGRQEKAESEAKEKNKPKRVTIKLKVTPKASPVRDKKGKGKAIEEPAPTSTPPKDGAGGTDDASVWDGAGWDSDLSALTDSDSESTKVEEAPRPSFKIRIPARTPNGSPAKLAEQSSPASASAVASASLPTPPPSTAGTPEAPRFCTIARCRVPLPPLSLYRWKCCSACRKQYREYQRDRLARLAGSNPNNAANTTTTATTTEAAPQPPRPPRPSPLPPHIEALRAAAVQKEWQRLENRRALEVAGVPIPPAPLRSREPGTWSLAPGVLQRKLEPAPRRVEGARVCTGRGCGHVIPSEAEYAGKMCAMCQGRERRKVARESGKEGKEAAKEVDKEMEDLPLAPVKRPGRCIYADCGALIPADASEVTVAECEQCLRRKTQRRPPGRPPGSQNKAKALPAAVTPAAVKPVFLWHPRVPATAPEKPPEAPRKRKRVSPYPAYQCRDALLQDFGGRFHSFIQAQSYYFLMRGGAMDPAAAAQPPAQAMFDFSGEYSVVARDLDVVARKGEVELGVHAVKDLVARAGGLEFSPTSWVSILGNPGGIVTRFACVHLVNVFLPIRVPPGHPPNPARPKSMQGELEIAVLPDDSHKYFAGEKTIVRFRLVG